MIVYYLCKLKMEIGKKPQNIRIKWKQVTNLTLIKGILLRVENLKSCIFSSIKMSYTNICKGIADTDGM